MFVYNAVPYVSFDFPVRLQTYSSLKNWMQNSSKFRCGKQNFDILLYVYFSWKYLARNRRKFIDSTDVLSVFFLELKMLACLSASNLQIAKLKSPDITRVFTFCTLLADCSFLWFFFSVQTVFACIYLFILSWYYIPANCSESFLLILLLINYGNYCWI